MKKNRVVIAVCILALLFGMIVVSMLERRQGNSELVAVRSKQELLQIYQGNYQVLPDTLINILTMPFSFLAGVWFDYAYIDSSISNGAIGSMGGMEVDSALNESSSTSTGSSQGSKDYSTTNLQVENVDEADITKTDGDYIYSLSENRVIITDVREPSQIKIAATIKIAEGMPEDLLLAQDKLVVIATSLTTATGYSYANQSNTMVKVYNIVNKEKPTLEKEYELMQPYYTSRCIANKLYVIASGRLRKEEDEIVTYYKEDNKEVKMQANETKYIKDKKTNDQTLIAMLDLNNPTQKVILHSYLMNISNAYVSENSIYLADYQYNYNQYTPPVHSLFGLKGAIGPFVYEKEAKERSRYQTQIYKFDLLEDGSIKYVAKTKIAGRTINQFSLDEHKGNLRVAVYDNNGSQVVVLNEKLEKIGETPKVAKGENMYSSRFLGDKAYFVTYKTIDPLYVIDVSNPTAPTVLGELKIPGYSTYLHPYDENHLIGIGMETEETVNRNASGRVISTTAKITGMKMALFDVSDVNHPNQIASTVIGDSRTTSAILTNHKALLFSKEKELIAIPVNQYQEDFEITSSSTATHESAVRSYTNYSKPYVAEGYFVYKINLQDGFSLKGIVNHEKVRNSYSYGNTKLLRGLYIDDNLYTVSETAIKVNKLENLELVSELKIRRGAYGE